MATATRTINRTSGAKIEVTLRRDVIDDIAWADGYNINLGRKISERTDICVTLPDGHKEYGERASLLNGRYPQQAKMIAKGAYACINPRMTISKDAYEQIVAALADLDAEAGKSDEYLAIRAAEAERKARGEENERRMAAEQQERENHPGYCKRCQDYTYGDCSHR